MSDAKHYECTLSVIYGAYWKERDGRRTEHQKDKTILYVRKKTDRQLGRASEKLSWSNVQLKRKTYDNIIIVTIMRNKANVCVTRPMVRLYGRRPYEEISVRLSEIRIIWVK